MILGGHPVALVGQSKDFYQHFNCHGPGENLHECRTHPLQ